MCLRRQVRRDVRSRVTVLCSLLLCSQILTVPERWLRGFRSCHTWGSWEERGVAVTPIAGENGASQVLLKFESVKSLLCSEHLRDIASHSEIKPEFSQWPLGSKDWLSHFFPDFPSLPPSRGWAAQLQPCCLPV